MNQTAMAAPRASLPAEGRLTVRYLAAAASAAIAVIYYLIGFSVVTVVVPKPGDGNAQLMFGLPAALAFTLGAALLVASDRKVLWGLGAVLQVMVMAMYFAVAPSREPHFEVWGVAIRVLQVVLLAALAYLLVRPQARSK